MPDTSSGSDEVKSSASLEPVVAWRLWRWYLAERPLFGDVNASELLDWVARAFPQWRRVEYAEGVQKLLELKQDSDGYDREL